MNTVRADREPPKIKIFQDTSRAAQDSHLALNSLLEAEQKLAGALLVFRVNIGRCHKEMLRVKTLVDQHAPRFSEHLSGMISIPFIPAPVSVRQPIDLADIDAPRTVLQPTMNNPFKDPPVIKRCSTPDCLLSEDPYALEDEWKVEKAERDHNRCYVESVPVRQPQPVEWNMENGLKRKSSKEGEEEPKRFKLETEDIIMNVPETPPSCLVTTREYCPKAPCCNRKVTFYRKGAGRRQVAAALERKE